MKNKKGFTLVEVLGVVVLIAIIFLISYTTILNHFKHTQDKIDENTFSLLKSATKDYMNDNKDDYPENNKNVFCIDVNELIDNNYIDEDTVVSKDNKLLAKIMEVSYDSDGYEKYNIVNECKKFIYDPTNDILAGYKQVQYIGSNGRQWLDTEFVADKGMTVEYGVSYSSGGGYVIGSHNIEASGRNSGYYNMYVKGWELGYGDYYLYNNDPITYNKEYIVKFSTVVGNAYLFVNDKKIIESKNTTTISKNTVKIFYSEYDMNHGSTITTKANLYYAKIYDNNDNLVRDYVPVLDKDERPCLFDKVEKKCYYNKGSSELTYELYED